MGGISLNIDDGGIIGVSGGLGVAEEFPEEPNIPPPPPPPTGPAAPAGANECMQQPWPAHAAAAAAAAIVGSAFMSASKISSRLIKW